MPLSEGAPMIKPIVTLFLFLNDVALRIKGPSQRSPPEDGPGAFAPLPLYEFGTVNYWRGEVDNISNWLRKSLKYFMQSYALSRRCRPNHQNARPYLKKYSIDWNQKDGSLTNEDHYLWITQRQCSRLLWQYGQNSKISFFFWRYM